MNHDHLTDDHLQDYLDGNIPESDPRTIHLNDCPRCRQALAIYKNLYSAMESDADITLSPDFADAVMARVTRMQPAPEAETFRGFQVRDSVIVLVFLAAVAAVGIYFLNPAELIAPFTKLSGMPKLSDNRLFTDIYSHLQGMGKNTMTVMFTLLTFIGIGAIDRIIIARRQHHKPISYLI